MSHTLAGGVPGSTESWTYNPAAQIEALTQGQSPYVWSGQPTSAVGTPLTFNGLNQNSALAVLAQGYDDKGNLKYDGLRTFSYDGENRLTDVVLGAGLGIAYDPTGRLRATISPTVPTPTRTFFLYDGDKLVAEYTNTYAAGGTLMRRYVPGTGVDEPLVWYEGTGSTDKRWFHANRQGSIVAVTNGTGALALNAANSPMAYTYGPYGEPQDWQGSRFRYTGQIALPQAQLYHYKARAYDPAMGRFLQTDPIGQADDPNLYAYVGGDPGNNTDPTGTLVVVGGSEPYADIMRGNLEQLRSTPAGRRLVEKAESSPFVIMIQPPSGSLMKSGTTVAFNDGAYNGTGSGSAIVLDAWDTSSGRDSSGSTHTYTYITLGHELGHAIQNAEGRAIRTDATYPGPKGSTHPVETEALAGENAVRKENRQPTRRWYNPRDLPKPTGPRQGKESPNDQYPVWDGMIHQ